MSNWIQEIYEKTAIIKITFGTGKENKPNDYCYWDDDYYGRAQWVENDEHFKGRILESLNQKVTK